MPTRRAVWRVTRLTALVDAVSVKRQLPCWRQGMGGIQFTEGPDRPAAKVNTLHLGKPSVVNVRCLDPITLNAQEDRAHQDKVPGVQRDCGALREKLTDPLRVALEGRHHDPQQQPEDDEHDTLHPATSLNPTRPGSTPSRRVSTSSVS